MNDKQTGEQTEKEDGKKMTMSQMLEKINTLGNDGPMAWGEIQHFIFTLPDEYHHLLLSLAYRVDRMAKQRALAAAANNIPGLAGSVDFIS